MRDVSSDLQITDAEWSADELIPFGKYVLLDRINSGATAAVYRANVRGEAGFERLVAIKRILPHMAGDRDFVDTFVREAKTVARLMHESICPIYELGKVGESLYMAVEYIQGRDLGQIMRRLERRGETMPSVVTGYITARLCEALDYAHTLKNSKGVRTGIIHRDLSPSNIVVSYEGQVKLIDFGLAKAVGRAQSTNVDALKKKLSYMSPEMVKGRPIDGRSDLFGVGICLYEMITSRRLFVGENDIETLKMVSRASVAPPSALVEDAPDELEIVAMHALEREPDDRFRNAAEMSEALHAYLHKTDPGFGSQHLAAFMRELFERDIEEEQQRIKRLLEASANLELIKQRRMFFASPSGAAARARAEIERRMTTEPPPGRMLPPLLPKPPAIPQEARAALANVIDDEATEFYDSDKTKAAPLEQIAQAFENEPTAFYPAAGPGPFSDEPTQFVIDQDIEDMGAIPALRPGTGGFDEESTTIFFNKEDGVGIQELLDEVDEVEADAGPLNRPIVAPELGAFAPGPRRSPPGGGVAGPGNAAITASNRPLTASGRPMSSHPSQRPARPTLEIEAPRRRSMWPLLVGVLAVLLVFAVLVLKTQIGVLLGARPPEPGTVDVRTTPGVLADVLLDDVYRGHPPLITDARPGAHRITLTADGYLPVTKSIVVESAKAVAVELSLVAEPAKEPDVVAPAAPVVEQPAQAPAPADHSTARSSDRSRRQDSVTTPRSHSSSGAANGLIAAPTTPAPTALGTLVVNTVPWSLVTIDGHDTGRTTPLLSYPIAPGLHELRLQIATGRVFVERIEVLPGQTVNITRRF